MGDEKNRENMHRHGIDFADATEGFSHPRLASLDDRKDYGEDRCALSLYAPGQTKCDRHAVPMEEKGCGAWSSLR
jgi:uncharacterized DUF497 family protein